MIVNAAAAVAENFAVGMPAMVQVGSEKVMMKPGQYPPAGIIGRIFQAAYKLLSGQSFRVSHGGMAVEVVQAKDAMATGMGPPSMIPAESAPMTDAGTRAVYIPPSQ